VLRIWKSSGATEELEGKRPFGSPKRSWDDNIKTDLKDICWEGVDWTHISQDRNKWRRL